MDPKVVVQAFRIVAKWQSLPTGVTHRYSVRYRWPTSSGIEICIAPYLTNAVRTTRIAPAMTNMQWRFEGAREISKPRFEHVDFR